MGRSPNTIACELKRNSYRADRYVAVRAKQKAYVRRKYAKYHGKKIQKNDELRSFIIQKLGEKWNPDEIAGYLKNNPGFGIYASKTAVYEWLRSEWGQKYCPLLYPRPYRRKQRKQNEPNRCMIPDRVSITERSLAALDRNEPGHCEYGSIVSSKRSRSTSALAVIVERSLRFVRAHLLINRKPEPYAKTVARLVRGLQAHSLTTDNGIENRQHRLITKKTDAPVFFTDPYSSW